MLRRLLKPWFIFRPEQLLRRVHYALLPPQPGLQKLRTAWGELLLDPGKTIGRSIAFTGVHDLVVSEAIFRLVVPGDTVADVGANVGYMTHLARIATGAGGEVLAFEPHPELHATLARNIEIGSGMPGTAPVKAFQVALGAQNGSALLSMPPSFEHNDGLGFITDSPANGARSFSVEVLTLDEAIGDAHIRIMKLDVEGHEPQVLRGAARALAERRITHIVFEDHEIGSSEVVPLLRSAGYALYALGRSLTGPRIAPIEAGSLATAYESPTFLATLSSEDVSNRYQNRGWLCLARRPKEPLAKPPLRV